jgi:[ribosomal protein S5]-alanine N-acetyltransferase
VKYLLDGEQTERLIFRKIQDSDFNEWVEFFRDPRTHMHWTPLQNQPDAECKQWYEKQHWRYENDLGGMNVLLEKKSGRLIGHCGLLVQTVDDVTELEIGYSLLPAFWNQGYASEAAKKCRDLAFENKFADSLISIISKTNIPSQTVATRNGMTIEKATIYHGNEVFIFRISYAEWHSKNSRP